MEPTLKAGAQARLVGYLGCLGQVLGSDSRRGSLAMYAKGLIGTLERKSVEPIAASACPDPALVDAVHQRLLHFIANANWSDSAVRREATSYALSAVVERTPIGSISTPPRRASQPKGAVRSQRPFSN